MTSRKHFRQVAEILRDAFMRIAHESPSKHPENSNQWAIVAQIRDRLASMFRRDNPNFDGGKFHDAATPEAKAEDVRKVA